MNPIVLRKIAAPKLKFGLPPKGLIWVIGAGAIPAFLQQYLFGGACCIGLYFYFLRRTDSNPFFLDEYDARKKYKKTKNIHETKGNYYSA